MKKFLVLSVLVVMALVSVSCSNATKAVTADIVSGALSTATVTALDCAGVDAVKTDVTAAVNKVFNVVSTATPTDKGIVQNLCKTVVAEVVPTLIGTTIPTAWSCKLNKLDNAAVVLADLACANVK